MKMISITGLCIALGTLFYCSTDSNPVFPEKKEIAVITGTVEPAGVKATIYLLDANIVDSTTTTSGFFSFDSVAYGTYQLKAVADSFGAVKITFSLSTPFYSFPGIVLKKRPSQIGSVIPDNNTLIKTLSDLPGSNDTAAIIAITFTKRMDTASFTNNISFFPATPFKVVKNSFSESNHYLSLSVPLRTLFSKTAIVLSLGKKIKSIYNEPLDFDYSLNYYPDTAYLSKVINFYFVTQSTPVNNALGVDPNSSLSITFKREMNRASVEKAFSTLPVSAPTFTWAKITGADNYYDLLTIKFISPLQPDTRYTAQLDSGIASLDSQVMERKYAFSFTTNDIAVIPLFPGNGQMMIPVDSAFILSLNAPVDSASFAGGFSIKPSCSMLDYAFTRELNNSTTIRVYHTPLSVNTPYTIGVDTTVKTNTGSKLKKRLSVTFQTLVSYPDSLLVKKSPFVLSTNPSSLLDQIDCNRSIIITFRKPMIRASVETRFSMTPAVLYTAEWANDNMVSLKPSQPFTSNTLFVLLLDSGFQTVDNLTGNTFKTTFKTKPLGIIGLDPVIGQISVAKNTLIIVKFNSAVDTSSLIAGIGVVPAVDSLMIQSAGYNYEYRLKHAAFSPSTKYTITFKKAIMDIYGSAMDRDYTGTFTTGK